MINPRRLPASRWAAAALALLAAGCTTAPKNPFAGRGAEPAKTAVSGSGEFASNEGLKNPAKVYLAYGQWQEQMGQLAEARESYGKVLAEQPKNVEALLGMARLDQANGLMNDAEERLKKAYKLSPKDPRVLATYGNFHAARNEWPKAIDKLQAAVKQAPDDARYQFLLGVALARSGDVDAAYPYFVRSVGEAQAHFNIGYILHERGDRAGSVQRFERALAISPDLVAAQEMLDKLQTRPGATLLTNGTAESQALRPAVRTVPLSSQEERVPLRGNETLLPTSAPPRTASPPASAPPAGLTPAQLEQWRNQQGW
jgi:tetratricopeptide (TPR) repeat protein